MLFWKSILPNLILTIILSFPFAYYIFYCADNIDFAPLKSLLRERLSLCDLELPNGPQKTRLECHYFYEEVLIYQAVCDNLIAELEEKSAHSRGIGAAAFLICFPIVMGSIVSVAYYSIWSCIGVAFIHLVAYGICFAVMHRVYARTKKLPEFHYSESDLMRFSDSVTAIKYKMSESGIEKTYKLLAVWEYISPLADRIRRRHFSASLMAWILLAAFVIAGARLVIGI